MDYDGQIVTRKTAISKNLKLYFDGIRCKNGHLAQRNTKSCKCVICAKEYSKAFNLIWYVENSERVIALQQQRNIEKPQAKKDSNQRYRQKHPAKVYAATRAWLLLNPEKNSQYQSDWVKRNPEAVRSFQQNRRARKLAVEGTHTGDEVKDLFHKQKGRCAYCTSSIKKGYHEDHHVSLKDGGTNWISNIRLTCGPCNHRKSSTDPLEFARKNGRLCF